MKLFKTVLLLSLFPLNAFAVSVVGDVVSATESCGVSLDGAAKIYITSTSITVPPSCKFDLAANLTGGAHTVTMTARTINDPIWGTQESAPSSPFAFSKPVSGGVTNLRLVP